MHQYLQNILDSDGRSSKITRQLLANLCVNARDAISGAGSIIIEIAQTTVDAIYCARHPKAVHCEYVLLAVSDDGGSMKKEILEKIFEPFFSTKRLRQGTRLGRRPSRHHQTK